VCDVCARVKEREKTCVCVCVCVRVSVQGKSCVCDVGARVLVVVWCVCVCVCVCAYGGLVRVWGFTFKKAKVLDFHQQSIQKPKTFTHQTAFETFRYLQETMF
jgi:hypothetical protein